MAFRFRLDEPIEKGFRRIGVEQIERARRQLAAGTDPASEVHEARKCMKRIRALLRLGRVGLGETVYRSENAHFRAIAASLASARDDHVLLETIVKLIAETESQTAAAALNRLKEAVTARRATQSADTAAGRAEADAALERAGRRFRRLDIAPDTFATLEQGLVRNYRKGIERRDVAYAENTDEAFHGWRKCVQTHWRHLALLSRAWPALLGAHIEAGRILAQLLGDDHDLSLLRHEMAALEPGTLSPPDVHRIEDLIAARQKALRRAARPKADLIFAERPKAHGRRIAGIWQGAVAMRREEKHDEEAAAGLTPKQSRAKTTPHVRG